MSATDVDAFRIALAAGFIASLITAQFLAVKVLVVALPIALPVVGGAILAPAGVIAIGITFLATDCYTELYGERPARRLVNVGFGTLVLMLALLWLAILLPGSGQGVDPELFAGVLGPSTNIVLGGLLAYLLSQHWDVFVFQRVREYTRDQHLWLRNLGSTATSQAIDTTVFIVVAFWVAPVALGIGTALPSTVLVSLILGQYLAKLAIAVLDTPFVYLITGAAKRDAGIGVTVAR